MPIHTRCPSCQRKLKVPTKFIGAGINCPKCQFGFVIVEEPEPQSRKGPAYQPALIDGRAADTQVPSGESGSALKRGSDASAKKESPVGQDDSRRSVLWYVIAKGQVLGPYPLAELRDLIRRSVVSPTSYIGKDPQGPWRPANRVKGVVAPPTATDFEFEFEEPASEDDTVAGMPAANPFLAPDSKTESPKAQSGKSRPRQSIWKNLASLVRWGEKATKNRS